MTQPATVAPAAIAADYTLRPSELADTLTLLVEARQPCIVWGPPGCAKSDIARQVAAALGRLYIDVRALLLDPVDLRGIPWRSMNVLERMLAEIVVQECRDEGIATDVPAVVQRYEAIAELLDQRTRWAPPSFLPPSHSDEQFLINLEELPSAVPMVQAALYQLVLDRRVGEYALPEGAALIACGNRETDRGVRGELCGLVQPLGRGEPPGAGGNRRGQGEEVAELAPLGPREAKAADLGS